MSYSKIGREKLTPNVQMQSLFLSSDPKNVIENSVRFSLITQQWNGMCKW